MKPTNYLIMIEHEVMFNEKPLIVIFESLVGVCDDGIGSYEYFGMKGYDSSPYIGLVDGDITVKNHKEFTPEELKYIKEYLDEKTNFKKLEKEFIKDYKDTVSYYGF